MTDELPRLPNDEGDDDTLPSDTRASQPIYDNPQQTSYIPAPPARGQPAPPRRPQPGPHAQPIPHRGRARRRRDSGLYLPLWSLILMLLIVVMIAVGIVVLVLNIGGNEAPEAPPVVIVNSPVPTQRPAEFPIAPATPTIPPEVDPNVQGIPDVPTPTIAFVLDGPTLEPVVFSPTPRVLTVGERVIVEDVSPDQLNVRDNPGVNGTNIVFRAPEGAQFTVIDGPQQADGLTWWQVQDVNNTARVGWAASNYLVLAPDVE